MRVHEQRRSIFATSHNRNRTLSAIEPKVVISYAHGSRDTDVIGLADRLNHEGVDCDIDVYDDAPPQGWARWMVDMMTSRTVIVVASKAYYQRFHRQERPGMGLGSTFESGLLVQRVVETQGKHQSIIPVVLESSDENYIPEFLRDATRYDLSALDGYDKLYRRLIGQPAYRKPPLGTVRTIQSATSGFKGSDRANVRPRTERPMTLFQSGDGMFAIAVNEVQRGASLRMDLEPSSQAELALIQGLRGQRQPFPVAYGTTAVYASIKQYHEVMRSGQNRVALELTEHPVENSIGSEMSYNGISADEIAGIRARRILLDETLQKRNGHNAMLDQLNNSTFESFVRGSIGSGNRLAITASPIPILAAKTDGITDELLTVARLACVMLLILSGTVERIVRLEFSQEDEGIGVRFEGIRHKVYSNRDPARINVSGLCRLHR